MCKISKNSTKEEIKKNTEKSFKRSKKVDKFKKNRDKLAHELGSAWVQTAELR